MTDHDPLCSHTRLGHDDDCVKCDIRGCECAVIALARADEREKAAQRVSETFWPTGGSWVTEETTFDAVGRSAIAAVRGES